MITPSSLTAAILLHWAGSDEARAALGAAFVVVAALDVLVACGLHLLLRDRTLPASVATLVSRSGYAVLLAFCALALALPGGDGVAGFRADWSLALGVLGIHLVIAALALWRARVVPGPVVAATGLAGTAYLLDQTLGASGDPLLAGLALPFMLGELVLAGWLLASGTRGHRVNSRWVTPESPGTTSTE